MSTRCQILFRFNGQYTEGEVLTYRHSDGYPESVLPDLVDFLKWNGGRNSDPSYTMANYFFWNKKRYQKYLDGGRIGYGLDFNGRLHGDVEYFYIVDFIDGKDRPFSYDTNMQFRIAVYDIHGEVPSTPIELQAVAEPIQTIHIKDIRTFNKSSLFPKKEAIA